jgi:thiopeptide-type bacteriocin biosynthesis protein
VNARGKWLSYLIYYYDEQDRLLTQCIRPLVDTLKSRESFVQYFFIRYWEGGPHIRFRVLAQNGDEALENVIETCIRTYLEVEPSTLDLSERVMREHFLKFSRLENVAVSFTVQPNNSLRRKEYEPEYDRYGGREGTICSEAHFFHSSELCLGLLRDMREKGRQRLTVAMAVTLTILEAFGMGIEDSLTILSKYSRVWQRYIPQDPRQVQDYFGQKYRAQKDKIVNYLHHYFHDKSKIIPEELLAPWMAHLDNTNEQMTQLYRNGQLTFQAEGDQYLKGLEHIPNYKLIPIVISYIHMSNNRLGIRPEQEAYLGFLLYKGLLEIADKMRLE